MQVETPTVKKKLFFHRSNQPIREMIDIVVCAHINHFDYLKFEFTFIEFIYLLK